MTVFWDAAQCSLVETEDVSNVLTASIIRAMICLTCQKSFSNRFTFSVWPSEELFYSTKVVTYDHNSVQSLINNKTI
jgi:hypothetical protein